MYYTIEFAVQELGGGGGFTHPPLGQGVGEKQLGRQTVDRHHKARPVKSINFAAEPLLLTMEEYRFHFEDLTRVS